MKIQFFVFIAAIINFQLSCGDKQESVTVSTPLEDPAIESPVKNIHIPVGPDSLSMSAEETAVIVVDMQNDFGSDGGMFERAGVDISMIKNVVTPTSKVLNAARQAGISIIYLKMGYHEDLSDLGAEGSPNHDRHKYFMHVGDTITAPDGSKTRILVRDQWGTDIVEELTPQPEDIVVYKTRFSGFYQTELDSILQANNKKYLVVTGCTTSICVESTVRDAMFRDYNAIVLEDCTAEPIGYGLSRSNHEASLLSIQSLLGWVSNSDAFVNAVSVVKTKPM